MKRKADRADGVGGTVVHHGSGWVHSYALTDYGPLSLPQWADSAWLLRKVEAECRSRTVVGGRYYCAWMDVFSDCARPDVVHLLEGCGPDGHALLAPGASTEGGARDTVNGDVIACDPAQFVYEVVERNGPPGMGAKVLAFLDENGGWSMNVATVWQWMMGNEGTSSMFGDLVRTWHVPAPLSVVPAPSLVVPSTPSLSTRCDSEGGCGASFCVCLCHLVAVRSHDELYSAEKVAPSQSTETTVSMSVRASQGASSRWQEVQGMI